jgi:inosine-uridine nucleoside N-ribohydrolase
MFLEYLIETLRATTEPLTLIPTGPLSNIAAMLALDPALTDAVDEIVIMGGGHAVTNVTASAEFNIWADPEAAKCVLDAPFRRVTLIPLDATYQALISSDDCANLEALGTPAGRATAQLIQRRIAAYANVLPGASAAPVHDVLCTAYLVAPEVVDLRHLHVTVDTTSELTLGRTVMDTRHDSRQPANAHVALSANADLLRALLSSTLG